MEQSESRKDWLNEACMAKLDRQDPTWHWVSWESVTGGQIVKGSPTTRKKDGSRKWAPKAEWVTLIITEADLDAAMARYATETGNCPTCCGSGKEWRGWNHETGHKFEHCRTCGATGKATP